MITRRRLITPRHHQHRDKHHKSHLSWVRSLHQLIPATLNRADRVEMSLLTPSTFMLLSGIIAMLYVQDVEHETHTVPRLKMAFVDTILRSEMGEKRVDGGIDRQLPPGIARRSRGDPAWVTSHASHTSHTCPWHDIVQSLLHLMMSTVQALARKKACLECKHRKIRCDGVSWTWRTCTYNVGLTHVLSLRATCCQESRHCLHLRHDR